MTRPMSGGVRAIRDFVAEHLAFLSDEGFREVGSEETEHDGGDAWLVVESDELRLRFVRDRGQLFLDLQPQAPAAEWFSVDLVRRLCLGRPERSAVLDEGYADFLREQLPDLLTRFAPDRWPGTREELVELKRVRSREMFGR